MRRSILLYLFCTLFSLSAAGLFAQDKMSLVKLPGLKNSQVIHLSNSGYDVARRGTDFAEIVVAAEEINALVKKGYRVKVIIEDLDAYIRKVQSSQTKFRSYHTFANVEKQLQKWSEDFSHICRVESIGKSHEGRDIWALKISDNPEVNEPEPAALLMGAHHAREWPSVEVPMATAKKLLEGYDVEEEITSLVNNREIWIVPVVNPDGLVYSMEKSRYWRKNRRNNGGTYGVDLNRNYGYQWGNVGASNSGSSDTYHGTHAFSEPEAVAIRDLALREKFQASISYHTYSELILYPFGYGYNIPNPDRKVFVKMAQDMARFNNYVPKNSAELYPAMGDSDDYLYGELNVLSFTFELCTTFIPSANQISKFNGINVPAALYLIDKCGTYGLVTPAAYDELIEALDIDACVRALADNVDLFGAESNIGMRNEALKQLEKISQRAAEVVLEDLRNGNSSAWSKLKNTEQAGLARSFLKNRVLFDAAHNNYQIRPELIEEIKNF